MKEYFNFNGVAKRQEYWAVMLLSIFAIIISLIAMLDPIGMVIAVALLIATIWVGLATTVRRLRDAGLNTWWILAIFVPYVGIIATIVFGVVATDTKPTVPDVS
jgi:uncharacterized membrane protein YhaH (DUF805 family)